MGKKQTLLAVATAAAATLGFAGSAQATTTVTGNHWDIGLAYDCDAEEFSAEGLHAHSHDTDPASELELADTVFQVSGTSNSIWESTVFGRAELPLKTIGDGGTYRVGLSVEAEGACEAPAVTFTSGAVTVPVGGARVAGYRRGESDGVATTRTRFDSATGTNRNLGVTIADHEDLRWGFTDTGTYRLPLTATASVGGFPVTYRATLTFSVV
ncbi:hypothetical protein VSS74_30960 [Conexibacter stalactiti]|uniref:WxL domain-containing protein n=1 Tax=Conexibacter stalactiti TaxID=1940611 RepID=A0ABU4I3H3_9ACTN|nr:hypothetical protein [Conexibacter stalactiti]MDW5598819.1 hypothetical protein [Conexibacter stalactiti]MEC5039461.1 hypothetical protein [Conexibacter stalactiti]